MNKLEQYRDKKAEEYVDSLKGKVSPEEVDFSEGFNAAMDLQLPVKFAVWQNTQRDETTGLLKLPYLSMSWVTLYKYWLENVYNPEEEI